MCRILTARSDQPFSITEKLQALSDIAENSRVFQGHGWGCAWLDEQQQWQHYKKIDPIWKDELAPFQQTTLLLAHARSAFKDQGITIENNMPFYDDQRVFIFNGELRGVRLQVPGRIGAEKIFNFIKQLDKGDLGEAIERATDIIHKRTEYVRSLNFIIATKEQLYSYCSFNEDPDYFTLHFRDKDGTVEISSEPYGDASTWRQQENHTLRSWS